MYFITTKRMLEVCFSAHPNIQYRTKKTGDENHRLKKYFYLKKSVEGVNFFVSLKLEVPFSWN